jgi:uncharacterized membrane protein
MTIVRLLITIIGILCVAMGLLWIGQGTGIIRWPASSFMIDVSGWATKGAILAVLGGVLIAVARRVGR